MNRVLKVIIALVFMVIPMLARKTPPAYTLPVTAFLVPASSDIPVESTVFAITLPKRDEVDIPLGTESTTLTTLSSAQAQVPLRTPSITSSSIASSITITPNISDSIGLISDVTTYANGSVASYHCVYEITGDMYGLGIRISFYVQSACNIISCIVLNRGVELGKASSVIMTLALAVAFGIGIQDPINQMVLEVQLFMALITMISLPMLSAVLIQWKKSQQNLGAQGSTIALAVIFVTSCVIALWGEINGRYTGVCKFFSGLAGTSVKARVGWNAWVALLSLLTVVALISLVACLVMIVGAFRRWEATEPKRIKERTWIQSQPYTCIFWSLFAVGIWITSVASVQLTIRIHKMTTSTLTDRDYGQWISLCVAICTVCTLIWAVLEENCNPWKIRSRQRTGSEDGVELGLTSLSKTSPDDERTRRQPEVDGRERPVLKGDQNTATTLPAVRESEPTPRKDAPLILDSERILLEGPAITVLSNDTGQNGSGSMAERKQQIEEPVHRAPEEREKGQVSTESEPMESDIIVSTYNSE